MLTMDTDVELVQAARSGDKAAFGELARRHETMALRIAKHMLNNREVARDLVQESMLEAYLSLDNLRDPGRFQSWLYGIVLNLCRNHRRRRKAEPLSLETLAGGVRFDAIEFALAEPGPHEIAEARELNQLVLEAVHDLSSANQEATLLYYYEQLSVREIAALLGISVAAVKGRLHKSRQILRTSLPDQLVAIYRDPPKHERKPAMIEVSVVDTVRNEESDHMIVVLADKSRSMILPIWVGAFEAESIALHLLERQAPRPMTYDFMASLLDAAGVRLEEVRVEALRETTFYAVAKLRVGQDVHEIDARPSDAISLALRTDTPIFVSEDVMKSAGDEIPEERRNSLQPRGLGQLEDAIAERHAKQQREREQADADPEEKAQAARQKLLAYLFDADETEDNA